VEASSTSTWKLFPEGGGIMSVTKALRRARTREGAEKQFWSDIKNLLTKDHGHSVRRTRQGIEQYQQEVIRRKLGEVVFNQGEELTAKVIDKIIRDGLRTPKEA
jgi:hypothetical protein